MSQICPYCGQEFILASQMWRCGLEPGFCLQGPSYNSTSNSYASYGRPSSSSSTDQSVFGFSGAAQFSQPFSPPQTLMKEICPDCGLTFKDLSNHKVCHKSGSGQYADKPQHVEMQVCPHCGKSFKNVANHKICHGRRSRQDDSFRYNNILLTPPPSPQQDIAPYFLPSCGRPDTAPRYSNKSSVKICHDRHSRQDDSFRSNTIHSLLTPPPSPQQGINPYFLPSYGSPDTVSRHRSNESSLQPLHPFLYETQSTSRRHVVVDNTESDDNVLTSPLYQSVQHSQSVQQRWHIRPLLNDHNGDQDEEEAMAIASAASLDEEQTTGLPPPRTSEREVEDHLRLCVRRRLFKRLRLNREDIWRSSFRHFKAVTVANTDRLLKVVFHNSSGDLEQVVDEGGPRQEYLRLLCETIVRDSGMLYGNPELGLLVRPSTSKYLKSHFRILGIMLATIIAQRGQLPAIFAAPVIDAILDDEPMATLKHIPLKYVPDPEIRNSLEKVRDAKDASELEEALKGCQWRYDLDGVPARVTMATREKFVNICVHYFVILKSRPMMDQMTRGLKHCGIIGLIRKYKLRHFLEFDPNMTMTYKKRSWVI